MLKRHWKHITVVSVVLSSMVACGIEEPIDEPPPPGDTDELSVPLAVVSKENGNTVEFYEPEPGVVVVSETGPIANTWSLSDKDLATKSTLGLYHAVAGQDAVVPTSLKAAIERAKLRPKPTPERSAEIAKRTAALSNGVQYGSCALAQSFAASGPNFGGMEGSYATSGKDQVFDKHYYRFTLCVYAQSKSGTISMDAYQRRWWTWKKYGYWVTSRGYFRWWSHTDNSYDFDAQTRFWNGSGLKHDHYTNCLPSNYNCWF